MNKVITINLGGSAFQLEETGYDLLRSYLERCAGQLAANPDRDEIIADIERAIADKFRPLLGAYKTVVLRGEVEAVIAEMGPVDEGSAAPGSDPKGASGPEGGPAATNAPPDGADTAWTARRLFRLGEGKMLAGVCNGLGAYLNLDTTLIRLAFVLLTIFTGGTCVLVYLVMIFVVPVAQTPAEKAAAQGAPVTAQEFVRRSMAGFYEGTKVFPTPEARREWQTKFKRDMRAWSQSIRKEMPPSGWNWQPNGGPEARPVGKALLWSLIFLLVSALAAWFLASLVSFLRAGGGFGNVLYNGLPFWVDLVLVFVGYQIVVLPLRLVRAFSYQPSNRKAARPFPLLFLFDLLIGIVLALTLIWWANHHLPEVRNAIDGVSSVFTSR